MINDITNHKLERLPEVLHRTGLTRSVLYRLIAAQQFPKPVKLGERAIAWHAGAVDEWIRAKVAA